MNKGKSLGGKASAFLATALALGATSGGMAPITMSRGAVTRSNSSDASKKPDNKRKNKRKQQKACRKANRR